MNTHPSAVLLQALEDGEIGTRRRAALQSHVDSCAACQGRLDEMRALSRNFSDALARFDRAGEVALARLAAAGPTIALPAVARPGVPRPWLKAAAIATLLVAGTSAAGLSALWLRDRLMTRDEAVTAAAPAAAPEAGFASGFTVVPSTAELRIELAGLAADSRVQVRLVDDAELSVDVLAADAPVRFGDQRAGRIDVTVTGRADVTITLPRSLRTATLVVDGVVRATKTGGRLDITPAEGGVTVTAANGVEAGR